VGFVGGIVTDHVLRAQVTDNLVGYLRQLGNRLGKESAASRFARQSINQVNSFIARTLSD
jgi:carbon monoxide dehydrogenase subunit G